MKGDKLRVVWFSNTAGSAYEYLGVSALGGGWVKALEAALKEKVELHVAFYYPKYSEPFEFNGIYYYPICKKNWKWEMFKNQFIGEFIDKEDITLYEELIHKIDPDLIHIHGTENPFGCIIGKAEKPVVVSIQGNITVYHHKYFSGIDRSELFRAYISCRSFQDIPFIKSFKRTYRKFCRMHDREIRNLQQCRYVIGRTDWDYRITRVLAPESTYFHGDELLRDSFYLSEWQANFNDKLIIHTTNGNSPFKGFETVCQALYLLISNGIDVEWRVAGIKENDLIVKVVKTKLGRKYPVRELVLLGGLSEEQLAQKLLEADFYVMPSHIENSPNNFCEAMMVGMPCIATYAGGTGSLLNDGQEGILIQDGDPWAMAGAILELSNNREKAIEMGKKARERARQRHSKEAVVNQYYDIYKSIVTTHT